MTNDATMSFLSPLYVVAAPLGQDADAVQPAFLIGESPLSTFDEDVLPALAGIWYAMHLPKTRFETLDTPLLGVQYQVNGFPRSHSIALVPDALLEKTDLMRRLIAPYEPALMIASADRIDAAARISDELHFTLPPARLDVLDQVTLDDHWRRLSARWSQDWPNNAVVDPTVPRWSWPIKQDGSLLSLQRLSRLMGAPLETMAEYAEPFESAAHVLYRRVYLDTLVQLEQEGIGTDTVSEVLPAAMRVMSRSTRTRLTVSISGTAPPYVRFASGTDGVTKMPFNDNFPHVRTLLVTHSATGDDSMGIVLERRSPPRPFRPWPISRNIGRRRKAARDLPPFAAF